MLDVRHASLASILTVALCGAANAQEARDDSFEDIIVTAQRTDQRLQDVPVSVTAVTAAEIDRKQINSALDLNRVAPNVQFDGVTGGTTGLKPYIRGGGITDGGFVLSESEVAIYIDDVYMARLSGAAVDMAVLDRIEVLRGPQGVLYGRNSSAGAVNFITRGPSDTFNGMLEVGYGTWNERRAKGYISTPLTADGKLRISASGLVRARDGGAQYNATLDKKVGANNFEGGQVDLAYVSDTFNMRLTGFYMNTNSDGQYAVNTVLNEDGTDRVPISGSYRTVLSPVESYTDNEQYGVRLHMSVEYPGGELRSITGYSELDEEWREDFSGGVPPSFLGQAGDTPLALFDRTLGATQKQFSQELQAAGSIGTFVDYVAGLYYFHETADQSAYTVTFFVPATLNYQPVTDSFAGYAQGTFHLSDKLSLILAGRYTIDDKDLYGGFNGTYVNVTNTYKKFTPKAGIDFKITPDILVYASYSKGFKAGGYNGLAGDLNQLSTPFRPQITTAYEAGFKSTLLGNRLRLNIAAFQNDIKDRQQTANNNDGSFIIENYDVRIRGIEAEVSLKLLEGLTLYGNGALNDGKYTGVDSDVATLINNDPPSLPDYQFTVGFDYEVPVGPGTFGIGSDFRMTDAYFSTADNALIGSIPSREILNGYVNYEVGPLTFQVTGKNLTQVTAYQTGFGFSVVNPRFIIEPRTILGTVKFKF
ncbi:TonB-dependent receptor [Novosphingobium sp. PC22D]|uniref:TonB-dependent receptor n=1 Tax=Novosphingobium sp. PC22D TaxID=1962403 RepID=UPI001F0B35EE|nr:TonB-dependent receptor [Novosphingobium sp. PC22D]